MREKIHPRYEPVVFQDINTGDMFLTRSTLKITDNKKVKWEDGNEYPLVRLELTSASHPFYTGQQRLILTSGRVERFQQKYGKQKRA